MTTTFNVGGTVQIEAAIADGRVKATSGQSLKVNVEGFKYDIGGVRGTYDGAVAQSVTDDDTSYVYLDSAGALQIVTTGFPAAIHAPLARVVAASGEIVNIYEERVVIATSASVSGTCIVAFPVDGGIKGGNAGTSSNNGIASVTFDDVGESRNRWNIKPPGNYISGDLTFRILASVAGSPGSNSMRIGLHWTGESEGDTLPASYDYNVEQTKSLSGVSNDELFKFDITIPEADFDKTKDMYAFYLYRDGDHAGDTTTLTLHTHLCQLRYIGYLVAGQSGQ